MCGGLDLIQHIVAILVSLGNDAVYRNMAYAISETKSLAKQLKGMK